MARGGINKALVAQARASILQKGQNPSIDAVRVELGNTGSKSTIHRYLKELEEESSARLDDEALLGQPIKELVGRLAASLREQAQAAIDESRAGYEQRLEVLKGQLAAVEVANEGLEKALADKSLAHSQSMEELSALQASEQALKARELDAQQGVSKLMALLDEKQTQIDSLEEKHRHNREAMAHYRQSVKDQRDQDQRQHEQQVQQQNAEIRALNQTVSVKQAEITQLNKDYARLASELGAAQKSVAGLESVTRKQDALIKDLESQCQAHKTDAAGHRQTAATLALEREALVEQVRILTAAREGSVVKIAKLEAEIHVKNALIERLMPPKPDETEEQVLDAHEEPPKG